MLRHRGGVSTSLRTATAGGGEGEQVMQAEHGAIADSNTPRGRVSTKGDEVPLEVAAKFDLAGTSGDAGEMGVGRWRMEHRY